MLFSSTIETEKDKKNLQTSLKPLAFATTVFSTVAITGCLIMFPLIMHYIQILESNVQMDLNFCKVIKQILFFADL